MISYEYNSSFSVMSSDVGKFYSALYSREFSPDIKQFSVDGILAVKNNSKGLQKLGVTYNNIGGKLLDGSTFSISALHGPESTKSLKGLSSTRKAHTQANDKKPASSFTDTIKEKQPANNDSRIER